ncbi:MAG TPA: ribonuclease III [Candidatus Polarisedimenticolaceae bacterium]|nr:ribonuclease III [Candidatus Polarisedimenticolaceae bacterium]
MSRPSIDRTAGGLERALGYRFRDRTLLERALTHRSHVHEREGETGESYERLEFLGDALLGMFVADWLYRKDPRAGEGTLSRGRQTVVRASSLARIASALGLGDAILLGRGEELTGGRLKRSLLADVFEAVVAAIYLDGGLRQARAFVHRHLGPELGRAVGPSPASDDFKTRLQEVVQGTLQRTPSYRIVSTAGPAHALSFVVEVLVGDEVLGRGRGSNRKRAEQEAARCALDRFESTDR